MKIFLAVSCLLVAVSVSFAETANGKIISAIREYVVTAKPEWKTEDIRISYRGNDSALASLNELKNISCKIPENYRMSKITPRMIIPIVAYEGNVEKAAINLWIKIEIYKDIVIAKDRIKRGSLISSSDIELSKREISLLPQKYFSEIESIVGKISKGTIYQGSVVYEWMIKEMPEVFKGSKIKILAKGDGILVEAEGSALQDGRIGDKIKVRRNNSKNDIEAKIISSKEVEVVL